MTEEENEKFNYKNSIVVFLDILGFTEIIRKTEKNGLNKKDIKKIYNILKKVDNWSTYEEMISFMQGNEKTKTNRLFDNKKFETIKNQIEKTCFSDSLVITLPYWEVNFFDRIVFIIYSLVILISKLARENFFIRGGIAIGEMFHDSTIFYGPALLKAYDLESRIANYPRVVLSSELEERINNPTVKIPYIKTSEDGLKYIDWIGFINNNKSSKDMWQIDKIKDFISNNIKFNNKNLKVKAKYEWLKKQFENSK